MIRFIVREVYVGHVVHAGGQPSTRIYSIDGDLKKLESILRLKDLPEGSDRSYCTRELLGIELRDDTEVQSEKQ